MLGDRLLHLLKQPPFRLLPVIFSLAFFTSVLLPTQERGKGNVNPAFWENSAA